MIYFFMFVYVKIVNIFGNILYVWKNYIFYVSVNKKTPNQFVLTNFLKTQTKFNKWCISNLGFGYLQPSCTAVNSNKNFLYILYIYTFL